MKPKSGGFFWAGLVLLALFLGVLFLESTRAFSAADLWTTKWLQSVIADVWDTPFSIFSLLGALELTSLLVALVAYWIYRREGRLYFPLILFGMILVLELVGKFFLYHPGPPPEFFRFNLPWHFPSAYVYTSYSFPSGHVSRTAFLTIMGIFLVQKYAQGHGRRVLLSFLVGFVCLLMVVSRVYLGEHWASDVIGGLLLGGSIGLFALMYY